MSESNGFEKEETIHEVLPVSGMYENWFLDYASYVILERAVPAINDGFKPVQRRILHALKEMDDGRFNKVANIIGSTMQYHPHGDASIGDAIVNIGQKELLLDTQGNWGDIRTGDSAAAPRYIEARLSKFALEVLYNPQTTDWQLSYDGRKQEPVTLPVKFPLLLAMGVEGIAVGLSTKILPHNFIEIIEAAIKYLNGKSFKLYPDFPTGGTADVEDYNNGLRGGRIKVRARIESVDKNTLLVKDIPFGTTTTGIIDSIIKANDKGKIKIKHVVDNTAKDVEINITLASGQSPDITIDALYAFTDCEVSISPNSSVIVDNKPHFLKVEEMLRINVDQTVGLLTRELEIKRDELKEKMLFSSLEKIFIENRIYRNIEECETWEAVIETIDKGLDPFKSQFYREITEDDIVRLTEIKIKRISRFDAFKADELMKRLAEDLSETEHHLENITEYAIAYYENILKKYGKGRERKTELKSFETIDTTMVVANNQKLYVNRKDGFIGWGLKKDEFVQECSDIDDVIVIRKDGKCVVSRIADKVFMGKDILHVGVWKKGDDRMVYNLIYLDGKTGRSMIKRFNVTAVTRDKEYDVVKKHANSRVLYLTANPNGEAEIVTVKLTSSSSARKKIFDFDFSEIDIKGKSAGGNILTKYPVRRVDLKEEGSSTLSGLDIWYDKSIGKLNRDQVGEFVGNFNADDNVIVFYKDGSYELTSYELTNKYDATKIEIIEKFEPENVYSAIHYDGKSKNYYVKRFLIETSTIDKKFEFISEEKGSKLSFVSSAKNPMVELEIRKKKGDDKEKEVVDLSTIIDVKGWKAIGNKLSSYQVYKIKGLEPIEEDKKADDDNEDKIEEKEEKSIEEPVESKTVEQPKTTVVKEEKPEEKKESAEEKPEAKEKIKPDLSPKKNTKGNGFHPGDTIELDF